MADSRTPAPMFALRAPATIRSMAGTASMATVTAGSRIPATTLYGKTPAEAITTDSLFKGKKVLLFGVPGAFTPGCSKTHLPGYVDNYDKFKSLGFDEIACVSVNDPYVMTAWGESAKAEGKVRMLADTTGAFTKAIGMDIDKTAALGGLRSKRYAAVVEDGVIKSVAVEPDGTGLSCSLAPAVLSELK